ncbi:tyrosine-type recombinase/integrase [Streptomyces xinghaiensis]|uniref:tyrosine-type recombinase/integrase n=1 Tax=Streptomyces xinghaiensis TaxID=1038928 RepID=UPI0037A90127
MAEVYDRWHLSRPKKDAEPCPDHSSRTRTLVPSADHGKGKRWQVRWRGVDGQQRKENFDKRAQADTRAATVEADLARGLYVDPAAGRESFRAVGERWRTSAVHRPATAERVERALRNHVYPAFGDRPIASVRPSEVQTWIKGRAQVLAPSTLKVVYAYLVTIFRTAVRDRIIAANPCDGIKPPAKRRKEIIPLHPDAVGALAEAAPVWYRALIVLGAASGLRQGELFGLEVGDVDFLRREVHVRQQLVGPDGGEPYLGEPKTHESYRTVPLAKQAVEALSLHLARFPARETKIEDRTNPRKPRTRAAELLFLSERNEPFRRGAWSRTWAVAVRNANKALGERHAAAHARWVKRGRQGQEPELVQVPKGASMHDLRHFYASLLIRHREDVKTVQRRLGHAKPSITLDTYTHLWPDQEDTTRVAVEMVLNGVPSLCPGASGEVPGAQVRRLSQR